jgi:hypothetical protein
MADDQLLPADPSFLGDTNKKSKKCIIKGMGKYYSLILITLPIILISITTTRINENFYIERLVNSIIESNFTLSAPINVQNAYTHFKYNAFNMEAPALNIELLLKEQLRQFINVVNLN